MLPRRTSSNPLNRDTTNLPLNKLNVSTSIRRKILILCHTHGVRLPTRQSNILNLDLLNNVRISGERAGRPLSAGQHVRHTNLDLVKVIKHIQLGQVESSVVVDGVRVAGQNEIQPAAAALAACGDAELAADALQLVAVGVELLGGEGAAADAGGVGFYDSDHVLDAGGVEGEGLDSTAEAGGGGGDEGVGAVVEVEHEGIGTLDENVGGVLVLLQELKLVDNVGLQLGAVFLIAVSIMS